MMPLPCTPKVTLCSFNVYSIGFRFVLTSVAHLDTTTEKILTSGRRLMLITTITITHSFIHLRVKKMMIQNLINLKCGREEPGNYQLLRILWCRGLTTCMAAYRTGETIGQIFILWLRNHKFWIKKAHKTTTFSVMFVKRERTFASWNPKMMKRDISSF